MTRDAAVGLDVGATTTKGAIVTRAGEALLRVEVPTDRHAGTKSIIAVIEELIENAGDVDAQPVAVGVGAAGFIDAATGSVTFSPNLEYGDPEVDEAVRSRSGLPVVVDNDANAAAWGERRFGTAQGTDYLAYITLGTGIGSGFVVDGRLIRGYTGAGAELGHMVVDPDGPPCPCGLRGCLEQFASGTAIARIARAALKEGDHRSSILSFAGSIENVTALDVAKAAREYDEVARDVLAKAGRMLGVGLSNVANIFDPEVIVLGGGAVRAGEAFLGAARDQLARMTEAQRRRPMRLDVTSLAQDAGIIGAATLALDEVVQTERTQKRGLRER